MKNFFSKFFNKQEVIEEKEVDKVVSLVFLMIEVSLADQSIDESEIESLKKTLSNKFNIEEAQISSLISAGKESQEESLLFMNLQELSMMTLVLKKNTT